MQYTAETLTSSIVVVGDFNPAIFTPDWLEINDLIGSDDADVAREENPERPILVSHQVTSFESEWFALQVLGNLLSLTSKGGLSPALKDLAAGIFQLVPHTPVTAVGLNFMGHFKLASDDEYHRVGDTLAPKAIWNALYPDDAAGLAGLTIRIQYGPRGVPRQTKDGKSISVQPSSKLKFGAYLTYNDHHDVDTNEDELRPAERVAAIIDEQWETAWQDAVRVFDGVLSKTLTQGD